MSPWKAHGTQRKQGMNGLEAAYSKHLDDELAAGRILWRSKHEAIKLRLADNTFYTPDFLVLNIHGELEVHETKGSCFPEHNRVKLKVAAELFPFRFIICRLPPKKKG